MRFGNPAGRILEAAVEPEADLIVMGVRGASGHLSAHAPCPVLTVRAEKVRIRSSEVRESRFVLRRR